MKKSFITNLFSKWYFPNTKRVLVSRQDDTKLKGRLRYSTELADVKGKTIIIFGDAYGWYAQYALSHGAKLVHSLDLSQPSSLVFKLVKKKNFKHFRLSLLDFSPKTRYDLAVFLEVVEHLPPGNELKALKIIYKSLSKKGKLVFSTPYKSILSYISDPPSLLGHRHYSKNYLERLFKKARFKKYTITRGGNIWQTLDILLLYFLNNILKKRYNSKLDDAVDNEYPHNHGITIFILCQK